MRVRGRAAVAAAAFAATLAGATPALAAPPSPPPSRDSVTGSVVIGIGLPTSGYTIDASSGPGGEAPGGTIAVRGFILNIDVPVTCLRVRGSRAVVAGRYAAQGMTLDLVLVLEDAPAGAVDRGTASFFVNTPPPVCAGIDIDRLLPEVREGSVAIVDAPAPPPSKKDCDKEGWRQLGFPSKHACKEAVKGAPGRR